MGSGEVLIAYLQGNEALQSCGKGTHAADIKVAFKTTRTQLLVTNYSRSHDRRKEKGKEIKAKDPPRGGECGTHSALMCDRKTCSHPFCAPFLNLKFFSNSSSLFLSVRKADKSTIFTSAQGR